MFLLLVLVAVCAVLVIGGRKTLQPLCHLLSILLLLPSFLFAAACLVMKEATNRTLFYFIDVIISFVVAMYPWGTLVLLVCLALLVAAGFHSRWRRLAASTVAALVIASAVVMHTIAGLPEKPDDWIFFIPGILSLLIAGGLFMASGRKAGEFTFQYPGGMRIGSGLHEEALAGLLGQPGFERREKGGAGWVWYHLPALQEGAVTIDIELGFHDGALQQISLFQDDPALYGTGDRTGQENKEQLRAENTRSWLRARGFPVGHYAWGEVWAAYDPRSNFGSGGVRYSREARRPAPARSPEVKLPSGSHHFCHNPGNSLP